MKFAPPATDSSSMGTAPAMESVCVRMALPLWVSKGSVTNRFWPITTPTLI